MMNANTDPFSQPGPEIEDDSENVIVVEGEGGFWHFRSSVVVVILLSFPS